MNKKMMLLPLLFLILMAVPMVDASEGNETDVIILPPPPPLPITNETDPIIIVTDQDLASIQLQLYNIYDWMLTHDQLMMNSRSRIREINGTLNDRITNLTIDFEAVNMELQGEIDFQRTLIDELRHKVWLLNRGLEAERAMRNNITIMFGLFSVIIIVITYASARKEKAVEGVR